MAEEQQVQATETNETVDTQEKTVSLAEMQRRLAKAEEQHEKQLAELQASNQDQIAQAIEKYKAESELSGKELEEYRRQEAEREKQALLDKIANLEKEQTKRELTDEAIKTLGTRNLPVTDKVLSFVVRDTADDTLQAIDDMEAIITDIKAQYTTSQPPKTSNAIGGSDTSTSRSDIFRNANIRKK